jgi:hypothetical protein
MRFDVRRIGQVKTGDEPVGGRTRVKVATHKCAPPFCEAEFEIRWGIGIDASSALLDLGIARGLIDKSGSHLSFAGSPLGNGRERSRETLAQSTELQNTLRQAIVASGPVRPGRRVERRREKTPRWGGELLLVSLREDFERPIGARRWHYVAWQLEGVAVGHSSEDVEGDVAGVAVGDTDQRSDDRHVAPPVSARQLGVGRSSRTLPARTRRRPRRQRAAAQLRFGLA